MKTLRRVAVVGGKRTPFAKSFTKYKKTTNQELLTSVLQQMVREYHLENKILGDASFGSVIKHAADWNLSRESVLGSGLHPATPAYDIQRACGTGLEAAGQIALKIASGQIESGLAGGTDTNSDAPVGLTRDFAWKLLELKLAGGLSSKISAALKIRPHDLTPQILTVFEPRTGLSMGEHTEKMVQEWKVSREEQDQLAFESHQKAAAAYEEGFYKSMVFPFHGVEKDLIVRGDTTVEKLAKLKPVFDTSGAGSLTAGNSTALTDGASAVLLASEEEAQKNGWPVQAYFVDAQVAAVDFIGGEGLLMAPTVAVSDLLKRNNLSFADFDFFEIHEAFAGQALCNFKAWESESYCQKRLGRAKPLGSIDRKKLNLKGGSLALGHPFAATGGRIIASLAKQLQQRGQGRGLISICTAGGMGVAAILER